METVRRRILTVGLPLVWFSALLGLVSNWATEGGRRGKTVSGFLQALPTLPLLPLALLLAVTTLSGLALYAAYPWVLRRRLVTAMASPGEDGPVPVRYRFDATGITQHTADLDATVPGRFIRGLDEDRRHLFLVTDIDGEPIVLDKADLNREQADGVRDWGRHWAGHLPFADPADDADPFGDTPEEVVRGAYTLTAADRATLVRRTLDRPAMRRARIRSAVMLFVGLSLIYPGIVAFSWAVDPFRVPFAIAFPLFVEMVGTNFWQPAIGAAALAMLGLALEKRSRRGTEEKLGQTLAEEGRPGTVFVLADASGISVSHAGARAQFRWSGFTGCERRDDMIVLPLRWGSVLPLPLRAFAPDALARFEALVARHLSRGGTPA